MELRHAFLLAREIMDEHGLQNWSLEFDTAKRRAGKCRADAKIIGLSGPLTRLHPEDEVRDTILHEVAHALVGPKRGHDDVWRETAIAIGCSGLRCVPADAPRVVGHWMGVCPAGHTSDRHKRPERVLLCRSCAHLPIVQRVFEWTLRGQPVGMHPNYMQELTDLMNGTHSVRLRVGQAVRITAAGAYEGREGTIREVGRTRYKVALDEGTLTVLFPAVEAVLERGSTSSPSPGGG